MFKESNILCSHPEQFPYDPITGQNNEPVRVLVCECGKNQICPKCGYGFGCIPCDCDKTTPELLTGGRT
jgi:hypothetical protein